MTQKGFKRNVQFPKGKWVSSTGETFTGPSTKAMDVPLSELLWFKRKK